MNLIAALNQLQARIEYRFAMLTFSARRAEFYEDLAEALEDKGDLTPLLNKYRLRAGQRKQRGMSQLYGRWLRAMNSITFARALRGTVPTMDSMILESAEVTGNLPNGLRFLSNAVTIANRMRAIIWKAIGMPIFLTILLAGVITAFALGMVPVLSQIYEPPKWPFFGQVVYFMSRVVVVGGPFLTAGVVAVIVVFMRSLPRWTGRWRARFDKHAPYAIYRDYNAAIFLVTIASLMQAGVSLTEALQKTRESATPWLRWHIATMLKRLDQEPDNPARALDTGLFPQYLADRIVDFGERSNFRDALSKVGLQGVNKVIVVVERSSSVVNKVLYVVLGVVIGILVVGTIQTAMFADQALKAKVRGAQIRR